MLPLNTTATRSFLASIAALVAVVGSALAQDYTVTPSANASTITSSTGLSLSGTVSNPSNLDLGYAWNCTSHPSNGAPDIQDSASVTTAVTLHVPGSYTFALTAYDIDSSTSVEDYLTISFDPDLELDDPPAVSSIGDTYTITPGLLGYGGQDITFDFWQTTSPSIVLHSNDLYNTDPMGGHRYEVYFNYGQGYYNGSGNYIFHVRVTDGVTTDDLEVTIPY